ncbi:hypothetical protein CY35_03G023100 [Sphagnum magellanicum]|nr:hypothetical protein CY35_03G023100 [Sphagnum magellanicum]KAH9567312.1 hypothetical protein CY35_03G023100 [Sphagnum magellanicum]
MSVPDLLTDPNAVLLDRAQWRHGVAPDYTKANASFAAEKTKDWEKGSLQDMVSNLVKNWEKEASYKLDPSEWRTIDKENYRFSCNGGQKYTVEDMLRLGTYNALIGDTELYSATNTDFETSHEVFRKAMPEGFAWEVLDVYSGPPEVAFKWRHWGKMTGKLTCPLGHGTLEAEPTNDTIEIFGMAIAKVEPENGFKITEIEIYYEPNQIMSQLAGKAKRILVMA